MHIKPDLPCGNQITVSEQTTTTRKGHQGVNRLTRSCQGRWKKHRTKYQYDYENRLTKFNNGQVIIVYDSDGNRVKKITATTTNLYLVDTHNPSGYAQVLEELTVSGGATNFSKAYTYGLSLISYRDSGATLRFYGYDGHGSVRFWMGQGGAIRDTYVYDGYGTLVCSNLTTTTATNNYLYCGEQFDPDLGFYYLRARYLNPQTGRFWTMDTYEGDNEDPLTLHKYLYAHGNPVDGADPSGQQDTTTAVVLENIGLTLGTMPDFAPVVETKVGCKVEVRFGKLGPTHNIPKFLGDYYHAYIITTDNLTKRMGIFRGQPEHNAKPRPKTIWESLIADYGHLTYVSGIYTQQNGEQSTGDDADPGNIDPKATVLETDTPWAQENAKLTAEAHKIRDKKLKYTVPWCNCNNFASTLLLNAGITPPAALPVPVLPAQVPAWNQPLPNQ
jgi:RHS repeat-associated protein